MFIIMGLGYAIKRAGLVRREDFRVLTTILLHLTLPAAVMVNFDGFEIQYSLFLLSAMAFSFYFIGCGVGLWFARRADKESRAFLALNAAGFNTGLFTLAFIQTLLPAAGVVAITMFDIGNTATTAVFCYMIAAAIVSGKADFSPRAVFRALTHSFPFMTYSFVTILCLLHLRLPEVILAPARLLAAANTPLAMLSVGIGMEIRFEWKDVRLLLNSLLIRYCIAIPMALICWFLLPFDHTTRLAMVMVSFSPATMLGAIFTQNLGGNYALASAVISVSGIISAVIISVLVLILL